MYCFARYFQSHITVVYDGFTSMRRPGWQKIQIFTYMKEAARDGKDK
jgi:hypothetical protein